MQKPMGVIDAERLAAQRQVMSSSLLSALDTITLAVRFGPASREEIASAVAILSEAAHKHWMGREPQTETRNKLDSALAGLKALRPGT